MGKILEEERNVLNMQLKIEFAKM